MSQIGQNWDTDRLTADLATQVRTALGEALSHASRQAYKYFLERYDVQQPRIEWQGQTLRFKAVSPKTFLTSFGAISIDRRPYQANTGGPSYVPLDHFWDMDGHFATEDVRQAVCFAMAHMTAQEVEQRLTLCSLFRPSATAIRHRTNRTSTSSESIASRPRGACHQWMASRTGRRWRLITMIRTGRPPSPGMSSSSTRPCCAPLRTSSRSLLLR